MYLVLQKAEIYQYRPVWIYATATLKTTEAGHILIMSESHLSWGLLSFHISPKDKDPIYNQNILNEHMISYFLVTNITSLIDTQCQKRINLLQIIKWPKKKFHAEEMQISPCHNDIVTMFLFSIAKNRTAFWQSEKNGFPNTAKIISETLHLKSLCATH